MTPSLPQVDPRLTPDWSRLGQRLKPKYEELLSRFAFSLNLGPYIEAERSFREKLTNSDIEQRWWGPAKKWLQIGQSGCPLNISLSTPLHAPL